MTRLLIWVQWRQFLNGQLTGRQVAVFLLVLVLGLIFLGGLTIMAVVIASSSSPPALGAVVSIAFLVAATFIMMANLPTVFSQLFSNRDVELLFTLPIPTRSIFLARYGETMLRSGTFAIVLLFVPLLAYGVAGGVGWLYYPLLVVIVVSLVGGVVALCYLLSQLLVRVVPPSKSREIIAVLTALIGMLGALSGQIFAAVGNSEQVEGQLDGLPTLPGWLPVTWAGSALDGAAGGEASSLLPAAGLLLVSGALLAASSALVERSFRLGWVRMSGAGGRSVRGARRRSQTRSLSSPVMAIVLKELQTLRRDVREWIVIVPFLGFFGITVLNVGLFNSDSDSGQRGDTLASWLTLQGILVGTLSFSVTGFASLAIPREGLAIWTLRTVPLSGWQIALGKFWVYWAVTLGILVIAEVALAFALGWTIPATLGGLLVLAVVIGGTIGIGLWVGTFGAKYNPDKPAERLQLGASLLLVALSMLYLAFALGPAGLAVALPAILSGSSDTLDFLARLLAVVWLLLAGLGVTTLSLFLSARRIDAGVQMEIVEGKR